MYLYICIYIYIYTYIETYTQLAPDTPFGFEGEPPQGHLDVWHLDHHVSARAAGRGGAELVCKDSPVEGEVVIQNKNILTHVTYSSSVYVYIHTFLV